MNKKEFATTVLITETKKKSNDEISINSVDLLICEIEKLYNCLQQRQDISCWEKALRSPILYNYITKDEAKTRLVNFIMFHNRLPNEVWGLLDSLSLWNDETC
jgi:hypothetical protein